MQQQTTGRRRGKPSEEGFLLIMAIFLLFLLALSLTIAAPAIAKSIERDREQETMERGLQYRRAIQLYYRKFHAYPPNLQALVKTNNIRFLRKQYKDPMTGKADWKPIHYGENKAPTALGFFGQPLAGSGSSLGGIGPAGGNAAQSGFGSPTGSGGTFGSTSGGTFGAGSGSTFGSGSGGTFGAGSGGTMGTSPLGGGGSILGSSGGSSSSIFGSNGSSSSTAAGGASSPSDAGTGGAAGSGGSTGSTDSSGLGGQTFGGAGIIGFEPASPKKSILLHKKKDHFNEWEFVYDPISDMKMMNGSGTVGQSATGLGGTNGASGTSGTGGTTTNGTGFGGSSFGSGSGLGGGSTFGGSGGSFGSNP